ncbi:MAG: hypothetical protein WCS70_14125 [Verrucomicrobiota bacterium]
MRNRLIIAVTAVSLSVLALSHAGEVPPPTDGSANAQFRRTVDPSPRAASGRATFRVSNSGAKQTCTIQISDLTLTDFGIFIGASPTPDTNSLISGVAPLNRTNLKKGTWSRILTGVNGAPLEFDVPNLNDLAGGTIYIAGAEDNALESGVTNITGCATNITGTTTNITGCVTNTYFGIPLNTGGTGTVSTILWAPIPPILAKPAEFNYRNSLNMDLPPAPAPSPSAKGKVSVKFNNSQGQSILDIQGSNLTAGQTYTVFIGDTTNNPPFVLVDAGTMTSNKNGSDQQFLRDTKFGDPLPFQARDVIDLSGRVIQIRDAFGEVHLRGIIP